MALKIEDYLIYLRKEKNVKISVTNNEISIVANKAMLTTDLLNEIKSRKQDILGYFAKNANSRGSINIPVVEAKEYYKPSSAQKRLFFIQEFDKSSIAYNLPRFMRIEGFLNIHKIEKALKILINRHEILKTSFIVLDGEVYQKINNDEKISVLVEKSTKESINEDIKSFIQPFDLEKGSLFRLKVLEISENNFIILFDMHHIISDDISQSIFINEFMAIYNGEVLPAVKLQYKDFSEWQQSSEQIQRIQEHKEFWLNEFKEEVEILNIKTDYPRPREKQFSSDIITFTLNVQETKKLKEIAKQEGATLFTVLFSIYNILLNKLSGQEDITIGIASAGRQHEDLENVMGMFVNTLPIRNTPTGKASYTEFLSQLKSKVINCFDHQAFQYEELIQELKLERDPSRNPLFDVLFTYKEAEQQKLELNGLKIKPYQSNVNKAIFDIELTAQEANDEIILEFIYFKSLFSNTTIERYATYFKNIVKVITDNKEVSLSDINILTKKEEEQIRGEFNNTKSSYPEEETIISLFEKQAVQTPNNIAVVYGGKTFTYNELKLISDKIACYLQEVKGVRVGDLVGILLEREECLIPIIYSVLKAGAVYVPISPDYPKERINTVIEDSELKLLITRSQNLEGIVQGVGVVNLDTDLSLIESQEAKECKLEFTSQELAYVIYTSGSTGKPKGVMIKHHSVINRILWMQKQYPLTQQDVLIQKTPIVFDVSVWELFWWSFTGASLVLLKPGEEKEPLKIIETIKDYGVTTIHFVPSMLEAFLSVLNDQEHFISLKSLKQTFASGEALSLENVNLFGETLNKQCGTRLINLYGPTEATVDVSYYECTFSQKNNEVPIGKPIDNIQLYIVDIYNKLVPIGVSGELCIAGIGLGSGYLNNEALTRSKFVQLPCLNGERVYKTGDLARWMDDGNIEYLGRTDDQVKIRGYRIELGEVESHLLEYSLIEKVVVVPQDRNGVKYLAAFYVSNKEIEEEDVNLFLKQKLPEYMVPSNYMKIDNIPLTANGKVNKKALPKIELVSTIKYVAPRNEIENKMAQIWAEVLLLEKIGIHEDYFSVGGDSILAIKLIYEVNRQLCCEIKISELYTYNTVELLSSIVSQKQGVENIAYQKAEQEIIRFEENYRSINTYLGDEDKVFPMSGIEKGMVYYTMLKDNNEQSFHNILYHEQNVYPITFIDFNFSIFEKAIDLMVAKHEELRKVFDIDHFAHIIKGSIKPEVNYIDLTHLDRDRQEEYFIKKINEERIRATNFSNSVLWRINILKATEKLHYLILDNHHTVMDGWSLHALLTELNNTYVALLQNPNFVPDNINCTYRDQIIGEIVEINNQATKDFWKAELDGYSRFELSKINNNHEYITVFSELGSDLKSDLQELSKTIGVSLKHITFSAFLYTLSLLNNKRDIVVGITTNSRPQALDAEKMIGCFLNTVPFRIEVPEKSNWGDYIKAVHSKMLKLKEFDKLPLQEILKAVGEISNDGNPIFDIAFNYIDFWIVGDIVEAQEKNIEGLGFEHDKNDVNQNTLMDFHVKSTLNEFRVQLEYSTTIIDEALADKLISYFKIVLQQIVVNVNGTIDTDVLIPEKERRQLLSVNNFSDVNYPFEDTVLSIFEQRVKQVPNNIAVGYGNNSITYSELDELSNRVAVRLCERGVNREDIIGIYMERSIELIIGIFGILKAGAAYLPLDIELPRDRLSYILNDSKANLVLADRELPVNEQSVREVLLYKDISSVVSRKIKIQQKPEDLCYIIYTSGTTGAPKGTMVEHKNVVRLLFNDKFNFKFSNDDVWTMFHSQSFDFSVWEIFGPLLYGAKLVVVPKFVAKDSGDFIKLLEDQKVTVLNQTPGAFHNLMQEEMHNSSSLAKLRYVIFGGEALAPGCLKQWSDKYPDTKLINMYGITETTVHVTYKEITKSEIEQNISNIGRPLPTLSIYLFNDLKKLVPFGAVGEIYVGGHGVSRGYLGKEKLTKERFIQNPYNQSELLYRSGDLGKLNTSFELEYMGRNDEQVKIRGYRIELGEIQNVLSKKENIQKCIVTNYTDGDNNDLVAYYEADQELEIFELRLFLSNQLPDYMIPVYFVHLKSIPLTGNGKINKKLLPKPKSIAGTEYVKPKTKEELILSKVWSEVLSIEKVGIRDNYFVIGGDSIKSIQISSKVREYDYEVAVKDILNCPVIEELAQKLRPITRIADQSVVEGEGQLTPIQKWFYNNEIINRNHFNQSVMLNFEEGILKDSVELIFDKILEHHDALRMVFKKINSEVQPFNRGIENPIKVEEHNLKNASGQSDLKELANKIQTGINIEEGPLIKLGLFHMDNGSRLLIAIHHLVVDGISWRILLEDIDVLYNQLKTNSNFVLPRKSDSFINWSRSISNYLESNSFIESQEYWNKITSTIAERIIPDNELGSNCVREIETKSFSLNTQETKLLLSDIHTPFGTEITDILISALLLSLHESLDIDTIKIDLEGHGREELVQDVDISRTIGWFTSIYPVLFEKGSKQVKELIKYVKEELRNIPNKGIDYLIHRFNDGKGISQVTDVNSQIVFNYLGQFDSDVSNRSFEIASDFKGLEFGENEKRIHEWDISGLIVNNELTMSISYSKSQYKPETVGHFMDLFKENLKELIQFCNQYDSIEKTPSDLTYKDIPNELLETIQHELIIQDIYPLSPMQEGMLFHTLLNQQSDGYFEQMVYSVHGDINIQFVEQSANDLIERHEIFRTIFLHDSYEIPLQIVLNKREIDFNYLDLREEVAFSSSEEILESYKREDKAKKFDLQNDVLLRLTVIRTKDYEYEFIWSHHHILMDGWCMSIILNEYNAIYSSYISNSDTKLSEIVPYADYIKWLINKNPEDARKYWLDYLQGFDAKIEIPKKVGKRTNEYLMAEEVIELGDGITSALREMSESNGLTLNTIIQAAWSVLLMNYNNSNDVVFGSVVSGRSSEIERVEQIIGLFINTIPVRVCNEENNTFIELARKIQSENIEGTSYHYLSLPEIQSLSINRRELFDHIIVFENYPIAKEVEGHVSDDKSTYYVSKVNVFEQTNYDLVITVVPDNAMSIKLNYNENVIAPNTIANILEHLTNILSQITENNSVSVDRLNLMSVVERNTIIHQFNNTACDYPKDRTILDFFEEQVLKTPKNIALKYGSSTLTYLEFSQKVNKLSNFLLGNNIKEGDVIGVLSDRSFEMMIGIYAVLKVGGVYLPLDPSYPEERIDYIIENSEAKILLSQQSYLSKVSSKTTTFPLESDQIESCSDVCTVMECKPGGLAYIIYTSGSTGMPKGVMIEHHSLVNRICWMDKKYPLLESDVLIQKTTIVFDVSVWELFWWSMKGASLFLPNKNEEKEPTKMLKAIKEHKISIMHFVPSMLHVFLSELDETFDISDLKSLKYVFSSGEALGIYDVKKFNDILYKENYSKLINLYGPTEATIDVTYFDCSENFDYGLVPIGKPIDNTELYILNKNDDLQPIGLIGELCISGVQLAGGYINNQELTNLKFVKNPFDLQKLMYRTGDLARWLPDGNIEYLGRLDNQVKIRGFRIELGEIEKQLLSLDEVKDAAVITFGKDITNLRLAAFVVNVTGNISTFNIKRQLKKSLPEYMIPSVFQFINEIPITQNGKLNRTKLTSLLNAEIEDSKEEFYEPKLPIEIELANIWKELLEIEKVGLNNMFFDLGGHSLLIIRSNQRIKKQFGVDIPFNLYLNANLEQIAMEIQSELDKQKTILTIEELKVEN